MIGYTKLFSKSALPPLEMPGVALLLKIIALDGEDLAKPSNQPMVDVPRTGPCS